MTGSVTSATGGSPGLRVALADDSGIFRDGLRLLLEAAGVGVVASVGDAPALLAAVDETVPDVAVIDVRMPPTHTDEGLRAAIEIREREPRTASLVLSTYVEPVWLEKFLASAPSGVGYLLKDRVDDVGHLVEALHRVADGGVAVDPEVVAAMLASRRPHDPVDRLSPRERDVLALIAEGRSNAGISEELFLSVKTVESHVARIFRALDLDGDDLASNRRVRAAIQYLRAASR
ncbi:response regulator transcription factor [Intrasporangium sp.]|uniref:response regulator transcription factor n=1 Tax=Intrasporangium sp. TaxID=1925024 RepID=UPI00293AF37C|nr:response regulator transcription factor [Intrasporangium sp.]MDV3220396.1 response regulator transcription factor [Intrasporangium sp.]